MVNRQSRLFRAAITFEHRSLGVVFLVLLLASVWLTYAVFTKAFADYDEITLRSSHTGLQLPDRADVKMRGVPVGEVLDRVAHADGVTLTIGLFPNRREAVPANVTARILPKTLFGQKYVALNAPQGDQGPPIEPGATITEAEVSIEVEKVLSDMYPLLRAVQPAELNYTLTAIANALEGRGEAIGQNLTILNDYLQRVNPQLPLLVEDLRMLAEVSDVYRDVMPEVARLLRNSVTTGNTFVEKEAKIRALFTDVAAFSRTSEAWLRANGENVIRLGELSVPQLRLMEKYAPQYPCLFTGIVRAAPRQAEAFRGFTLHINLETLRHQPRGYSVQDDPRYGDKRGPIDTDLCWRGVNGEWSQRNLPPDSLVPNIDDGVDEPTGKQRPAPVVDLTSGIAGTRTEQQLVDALVGPALGERDGSVADLATLLFGPLARGAEVSVR